MGSSQSLQASIRSGMGRQENLFLFMYYETTSLLQSLCLQAAPRFRPILAGNTCMQSTCEETDFPLKILLACRHTREIDRNIRFSFSCVLRNLLWNSLKHASPSIEVFVASKLHDSSVRPIGSGYFIAANAVVSFHSLTLCVSP
jgi:hypothetical protein